jgi:hypothetical protein
MAKLLWSQRQDMGPSPRWSHAMAFDAVRKRTVLFGGKPARSSGTRGNGTGTCGFRSPTPVRRRAQDMQWRMTRIGTAWCCLAVRHRAILSAIPGSGR